MSESRDASLTSAQTFVDAALPRRSEEIGGATEPHSTPRSTATVLASAAAETEPITVTHTMLAYQVPTLATYSGEGRDVVTSPNWHEQLELVAGLCACQTCQACQPSH